MANGTCRECSNPTPLGKRGRPLAYCSKYCSNKRFAEAYRKRNPRSPERRRAEYYDIRCITCGELHRSARADGKYCSLLCRDYAKWGPRTCAWPRPQPRLPKPKPKPFVTRRQCQWCEAEFTTRLRTQVFCCADHKIKAKRNRRRGRQYGSTSHFTWAEFMRLFIALDQRCAYCDIRIEGQPDPDHVVPLSKGGSNGITNILPACRSCNSDKRDLLLNEWAADRERRGLPPRRTDVRAQPEWQHLTDALLVA